MLIQSIESPTVEVSVLSFLTLPRTDQFWVIMPVENGLPAKRRHTSAVPVALGVLAKLAQGLTMMSSSQLWMTAEPGPKAMFGKVAILSGSVHSQAQVVFSWHLSLSVMCWKMRAHSPNGITAMFIATGQDVANVAESSSGILYTELTPEGDLYMSLTIPSLIVATFGGGTGTTRTINIGMAGIRLAF